MRLTEAGIPAFYAQCTAQAAIHSSGYESILASKPDPAGFVKRTAAWLLDKPPVLLTIPDRAGLDTYPLGAYFAAQAAMRGPVLQMNGNALTQRQWEKNDATAHFFKPEFLLIFGFGCDSEHVWLRNLLYRLLYSRVEHRKATVITFAPAGSMGIEALYGSALATFLNTQKRFE